MLAEPFSLWHLAYSAFAYNIDFDPDQGGTRGKHNKLNVMFGSAQPGVMCHVPGHQDHRRRLQEKGSQASQS